MLDGRERRIDERIEEIKWIGDGRQMMVRIVVAFATEKVKYQ